MTALRRSLVLVFLEDLLGEISNCIATLKLDKYFFVCKYKKMRYYNNPLTINSSRTLYRYKVKYYIVVLIKF